MKQQIIRSTVWISLGILAMTLAIWFIVIVEAKISG